MGIVSDVAVIHSFYAVCAIVATSDFPLQIKAFRYDSYRGGKLFSFI